VESWFALEGALGFPGKDQGQDLSTLSRPPAVGMWIKCARSPKCPKETNTIEDFSNSVIKWWDALNPAWRICTAEGVLMQEGSGDWDKLDASGRNGLLSVLACLLWWYE
ncbi:hypothetical protein GYMLUDRAFT_142541, partial [Collybiopsis luxurians FD-317 M1]